MFDHDADTAPMQQPQRLPLRFVGSGSEYFRIWIVNLLLTLVTLGIYYPFAKVRKLKYFHVSIEVGGHPLSFHADPWKMVRGYALVAVLTGAYALAGRVSPVAGLVAFLILATVWPALWRASLRFRLANTGWLGLRARFAGGLPGAYGTMLPIFVPTLLLIVSAWIYTPASGAQTSAGPPPAPNLGMLLPLMLVVVAVPVALWAMKRYQHNHYSFAGESSRFGASVASFIWLFLRGAGVSLLAWLAFALVAAAVIMLAAATGVNMRGLRPTVAMAGPLVIGLLAVLAMQAFIKPWFTARLQNLVWNGTRSAHFSFESRLRFRSLAWLTAKNWLLIIATLGLYFPFAVMRTLKLRVEALTLISSVELGALAASAAVRDESAVGDAAGDFLGIDIGL
jgi:uncharacterized membrane protein YjgN (DUF898 family)